MRSRVTLAMLVLGFRLGPLAIGTTAILMRGETGAVRGARKGLASAVWLLKDRELLIGVCFANAIAAVVCALAVQTGKRLWLLLLKIFDYFPDV